MNNQYVNKLITEVMGDSMSKNTHELIDLIRDKESEQKF